MLLTWLAVFPGGIELESFYASGEAIPGSCPFPAMVKNGSGEPGERSPSSFIFGSRQTKDGIRMKAAWKVTSGSVLVVYALAFVVWGTPARASFCSMTGYKALPGLMAASDEKGLVMTWEGEKDVELR